MDSSLPSAAPERRQPVVRLSALGADPTVIERAKHYFGSAFNYVYERLRKAVLEIFESLKRKYESVRSIGFVDTFGAGNIGNKRHRLHLHLERQTAGGLMWHAIAHHKGGSSSTVDKALHMLAGA